MPTKKWSEIRRRSKLSDEQRAETDRRALADSRERARVTKIEELRRARHLTQTQLAEQLGMNQGAVSRLEHQSDLYLSTLRRFVQAVGGRLELVVTFNDDAPIELDLFGQIEENDVAPRELALS